MQLPDPRGEGSSDETTALQQCTDKHDAVGANPANEDSDERRDEHGNGEVEAADEGEVPG